MRIEPKRCGAACAISATSREKILPSSFAGPKGATNGCPSWLRNWFAVLTAYAQVIADFAVARRLPMCGFPEFTAAGGLMAYGINFPELEIRAAVFVDKILKGAAPGDLPIQRATNFKLTINLKTAKAIGVDLPTSLLVRADDVIE
jgi:hypothetical protein